MTSKEWQALKVGDIIEVAASSLSGTLIKITEIIERPAIAGIIIGGIPIGGRWRASMPENYKIYRPIQKTRLESILEDL